MNWIIKQMNKITGKQLAVSAIAFFVMFILMNILAANFETQTGVKVLDFTANYGAHKGYDILTQMGASGRQSYLLILGIDFVFPLIYGTFFASGIAYLLKKVNGTINKINVLIFLPIIVMLSDLIENIFIVAMLVIFPDEVSWFATIASTFTMIKNLFTFAMILICILLVILLAVKRFQNRKK